MKDKKILIIVVLLLVLIGLIIIAVAPFGNNGTTTTTKQETVENLELKIEDENASNLQGTDIVLTESLTITSQGTYNLSGTIENGSITVNVGDDDKVILVLNNVSITNSNGPAIYVENADKVTIVLKEGSTNNLTDGGTSEEIDGCIYSKDDLVISGKGTLNVVANNADGIVSKDDLKIIEGIINVNANDDGIRGKDSLEIKDATINVTSKQDGLKTTNDTEDDKGYMVIENSNLTINAGDDGINVENDLEIVSGTFNITAVDDAIHANGLLQIDDGSFDIKAAEGIEATYVKINGGTINIEASDDGINAGNKSDRYSITIEINGGYITIKMGSGDTDGIDSNGNLYINGGTIDVTANSPFDYDGQAQKNGGTLIVNGEETDTITNQFMGGGMQGGIQPGGMNQRMH